ncbi:hypothetical protein THAOC_27219 [Thalassiosira oceanica]|uniref:GTP cyclohydrolase II n=1 Tax=Thalassiosira oceanica TaxID=159749 RepID=K0RI17_THAOC|nr:hypothetical protein THAOC_27219 [Thalassiosira oceanica]|eukprot:EJK53363.1 hypothetical protein THAOC_27219 [Thalassiosira oceanica]
MPVIFQNSLALMSLLMSVAIVQSFASLSPSSKAPWGTRGGAHVATNDLSESTSLAMSKDRRKSNSVPSSPILHSLNEYGDLPRSKNAQDGANGVTKPSDGEMLENAIFPGGGGGFSDGSATPVTFVAETNLPTDIGHFRLRAYRVEEFEQALASSNPLGPGAGLGPEPCVIFASDKPPFGNRGGERGGAKAVPIRIHDQCFTSEVFRSRRCDCKEQLNMALSYIRENGGAIIYLQQEGRGIGLANKIAAYSLQDVGLDTVDANTHLGFPEDCRTYGVVPSILKDMGIDSIQLMTNNPRKVERLSSLGVDVVGTVPMVVPTANPYNKKYLETKQKRMRHANFGSMLEASPNAIMSADDSHVEFMLREANVPPEEPLAEEYINDGEEMAANAVTVALMDDPYQSGVVASDDGYCFGRKSVEEAIAAVARGELIVVVDDESRENEGDFIMAADLCTPEKMAEFIRYSSGVICIGMEGHRMDELELPAMVVDNEDPKETAFSVTVDATEEHGITTGISARDRCITSKMLANGDAKASDFHRPGHIFPLRAKENGVLTRDGHTEAAVDFARLAGSSPAGLLCEIVSEEHPTEMARLPELKRFCKRHGYVLTSIADLQQYRRDTENEA